MIKMKDLTKKEMEVLKLLAKGIQYKDIADILSVSINTIKKHTTNMYKKLEVKNRMEAYNKCKYFL